MDLLFQHQILAIIFSAAITENIALNYFLGICPFISISSDTKTAFQMGVTVTFVMIMTSAANWLIYYHLLIPNGFEDFHLLFFILTIAALVQFLETFIDRYFPALYSVFGIFLPLITVNCAVMGVSLFSIIRNYSLIETLLFSAGSGIGWTLAISLMGALRKRLDMDAIPKSLGKTGITMIIAAFMAMAFAGLSEAFSGGQPWKF